MILSFFASAASAQDQCIDLTQFTQVSTGFLQYDLKYGDFNGDNLQDIVYFQKNFAGPIRIINGTPGALTISDSITLASYYHVSSPGDINGDNYDDLLVSSSNRILIYYGASGGLSSIAARSIFLPDLLPSFTPTLIGFAEKYRDINSDGIMDILLTVGISGTTVNHGRLFILRGGSTGFSTVTSFTGVDFEIPFIAPVKNLGDLNGDGYIDIGFQQSDYYPLHLFYGGPDYFNSTRKNLFTLPGDISASDMVYNNAGDINDDGYNDLLVSFPHNDYVENGVFLFLGSSTVVNTSPAKIIGGTIFNYYIDETLGQSSGPAGDVNRDGIDDFFVSGGLGSYTHIYYGNTNVSQIDKQVNIGISPHTMIKAGDVNGDGDNDWISSFTISANARTFIGLIEGNSSGLDNVSSCPMSELPLALEFIARSGKTAGDVNNDGFNDILLGHDDLDPSGEDEFGKVEVVTGAPVGVGTGGMTYGVFQDYFGDQFGSGDFNGDGYSDVVAGRYGQYTLYIFYGSATGIDGTPDVYLSEDIMQGWGESIEDIGDLNNDGFDDFLSYGKNGMTLVQGSATGPTVFTGWNFGAFTAYKAGDGNNDGFTDFFLKVAEGYRLFRGSAGGPLIDSYVSSLEVKFAGDVNNDGFDDMLTYNPMNNSVGLLLGNATGYIDAGISLLNAFKPNGIGDFNGDGYDDIGVSSNLDTINFYGAPSRVDIYLGSATGIQTTIFTTIRANEKHHRLSAQPRIGDFNNDGREDLLVSSQYRSWLVYGIGGIPNIVCPPDTSFYADSTCFAEVNGVDPPGDAALYRHTVTGSSSFEGVGSLSGMNLNTGTYFVTYSLISNPEKLCSFTLRILDTIAPKLILPNSIVVCGSAGMNLNIPQLKIEPGCQINIVNFQLTGATNRSGTGLNASGSFNQGTTVVTWTVTDSSGNTSSGQINVSILESNFNVRIPKAYQINAQQSQANTIYLGYANNTLRLTAYEPNSSRHKYLWSNGDTTRYTRVTHNIPGTYGYSVIVTNDNGCSDTAYTTIKVVDNYCPNPLKDFITQFFPQLLNQPWIQALIASTSQMYLCYNGSTVCVNPAEVPAMISNGARLGKCGVIYESNDLITAKEEINSIGALTITASPNPSGYEFTLKIDGTKGKPYALRIINSVGSPVFMKQGITENIVRAGASFQKGVYFAEVICGQERKVIKLLKVR